MAPPAQEIDIERVLCRLADLKGGSREFRLGRGDWPLRGFVVEVHDGVRAYVNRCAHLNYPLNYMPHQFLSHDRSMIQCFVHGAIFEKTTGYCVAGPCSGLSLIALPVRVESGYVLLADEADPDELAARYA
jgi:nitrite reductase/ring-hydroxylating ferredoxin subunit